MDGLTNIERLRRLDPPKGKVRIVLDTDAYNEVDDQFALSYALKSKEKITVDAVYAAPFHNHRSTGPKDGMKKSYAEILNILNLLNISNNNFVFKGSTSFLKDEITPVQSDAAKDLVNRAMALEDELLYVVAIGAITNVASAILMEPSIVSKIVVVWLGGNGLFWPHNREFNLKQDLYSARIIFDCGVPLIHLPCSGVTSHLLTSIPELEHYLYGKSKIGSYLTDIVRNYTDQTYGWSKVIWDLAAIAWVVNSEWVTTNVIHSPIVTENLTWSFDNTRHFIRSATYLDRDQIFADVFRKLS